MAVVEERPPAAAAEPPAGAPSPDPESGTRLCASCQAPLAPDQAVCLECGTVDRERRWYRRFQAARWPGRVALATLAALIVTGSVGLGTSVALQGGGNMPKIAAKPAPVQPLVSPPAAPATPAPAPHVATPAPKAAPKTAKPAPVVPSPKPHAVTPAPTPNSTGTSNGTGGAATPTPVQQHHTGNPAPQAQSVPFPDGVSPAGAQLFDPNGNGTDDHPDQAIYATDGDPSTAWTTADYPNGLTKKGVGIWFDAGAPQAYSQLGLLTKTPGYTVDIYGSAASAPPASLPDPGWTLIGHQDTVTRKQRIALSDKTLQPRYYLVWITALAQGAKNAGISEASLIP